MNDKLTESLVMAYLRSMEETRKLKDRIHDSQIIAYAKALAEARGGNDVETTK